MNVCIKCSKHNMFNVDGKKRISEQTPANLSMVGMLTCP